MKIIVKRDRHTDRQGVREKAKEAETEKDRKGKGARGLHTEASIP